MPSGFHRRARRACPTRRLRLCGSDGESDAARLTPYPTSHLAQHGDGLPPSLTPKCHGPLGRPGCACLGETPTVRLLLDVWGALTWARQHPEAGNGLGGSRQHYAAPSQTPQPCHRFPNFNLVTAHPCWAPGFPRMVCNKARAYLVHRDPCPPFSQTRECSCPNIMPSRSWSWPVVLGLTQRAPSSSDLLLPIPSRISVCLVDFTFPFIVTVDPDIIHDSSRRCCVCVSPSLIASLSAAKPYALLSRRRPTGLAALPFFRKYAHF